MKVAELLPCDVLVTITVHRPGAQTSGSGGKPVETTTEVKQLDIGLEKLSGGQAQRAFGDQAKATWRGTADDDADVEVNDLIVVDAGPYVDTVLEVEDVRVPGGRLKILALADTDRVPD